MRATLAVVASVMLTAALCGMAVAGSIDSSGAPSSGSGMVTLQQMYNYLSSGIEVTPVPGFQEATSGPTAGTMKSIQQIYDDIKAKFTECNATTADNVEMGKPFFCTVSGRWGVQTGTGLMQPTPTPTSTSTITPTPTITPTLGPCGEITSFDYDGLIYNTVEIGSQCWMKENLNVGTMVTGATEQTNNSTIEKYCYSNTDSDCTIFGGLYQWAEAMQYKNGCSNTTPLQPTEPVQGICPAGWHIPTDAEWCTLERYVDSTITECTSGGWRGINAGTKLKVGGSSGFEFILTGERSYNGGTFQLMGTNTHGWASTESASSNAISAYIEASSTQVLTDRARKDYGFPIRCVRD